MYAAQVALDYWLEPLFPESLPMMAARLLADGYDSPALRKSAGISADDAVEAREVFVQALRELGVYLDSREDAQLGQLRPWLEQTLAGQFTRGELSARVGRIWSLHDLAGGDRWPSAVVEVVLTCLSDDYWVDDAEFVRAVREARRALE